LENFQTYGIIKNDNDNNKTINKNHERKHREETGKEKNQKYKGDKLIGYWKTQH
jgi:hypothetical protein